MLDDFRLSYFERTAEQALERFREGLTAVGITDGSDAEAAVHIGTMFAALLEHLSLMLDYKARQTFLSTVTQRTQAIAIARQFGYPVGGARRARVRLKLTVSPAQPYNVASGVTQCVETLDGVQYRIVEPPGVLTAQEKYVWAEEYTGETETVTATADGTEGFMVPLTTTVNAPEQTAITVTVDGVPYARVPTLLLSAPTERVFCTEAQAGGFMAVRFGDGITGAVPASGAAIEVTFETTVGEAGNVPGSTVFLPGQNFDQGTGGGAFASGTTFRIVAAGAGVAGRDMETLGELRRHVPAFSITNDRAVTTEDYADLLMVSPFRVAKARAVYQCGGTIRVYVIGFAGQQFGAAERAEMAAWLMPRSVIGPAIEVLNAGLIHVRQRWDVAVRPNYPNSATGAAVQAALAEYMGLGTTENAGRHEIGGSVYVGDLYQTGEAVPGVAHTTLTALYAVPYAEPLEGTAGALQFDFDPDLSYVGGAQAYRVSALNNTQYQLYKGTGFVGQFTVGQMVLLPQGTIAVTSGLSTGAKWRFTLYPTTTNLTLLENSIPFSEVADITINATGGY